MITDDTKFIKKAGAYRIAATGGVADAMLLNIGTKFEETMSRNGKALTSEEMCQRYVSIDQVLWSVKYDGEGVLLFFDATMEPVCFGAPSGRARMGFAALDEFAKKLLAAGVRKGLFRGELYLPITAGVPRGGIAAVVRTSFSGDLDEVSQMRLAVFDMLMLDGRDYREGQQEYGVIWARLAELFGTEEETGCHRVRGGVTAGSSLEALLLETVGSGHEGLILRKNDSHEWAKVKPRRNVDAVVIGYVEGETAAGIGVTSLLTALTHETGDGRCIVQTFVRVGSGLNDGQRMELLPRLKSMQVENPVLMNDSDGRPIYFVKPGLLIEVEGEDLVSTKQGDKLLRTQVFQWDEGANRWSYLGIAPCPRLTFATFGRLREDKSLAQGGARLTQILSDASLPVASTTAEQVEVLSRVIYRKADAIRKFVSVRKPSESSLPYVLYFTDYSPGRKDPLKVSVQYAISEERKDALWQEMLTENVKKGWELVS